MSKIKVPVKVCPECNSHLFKHDESKREMTCKLCGLVIHAPYNADFITPDLKIIHITISIPETVEVTRKK